MKKVLRFLLLAALLVPLGVRAQSGTLTICDGTENHQYVPFYGYYADANQHNQLIYPADSLTGMSGLAITQMVFYIDQTAENGSNTGASVMGTWTVSLGETSATTLSGLDNTTSLTEVYEGYFDCSTGTLTLTFDEAYVYSGGNLLVDLQHSAAGYNKWFFLGVTATGASYCYNDQRDFLPKVTFSYGAAPTCIRPTGLQALVSGDTATITWIDSVASAWDIVWGPMGFSPDTVTLNADMSYTTSYEITGLTSGMWQAYVRTNCGSETSSWLGPVSIPVGLFYMGTSGTDTIRTCGVDIYDNGGPNGDYSTNCMSTVVLLPSQEGSVLTISGSSQTEGSYDYLTIYDGVGTMGDVLFCDNESGDISLHAIGPFVSDAFTIVFSSDGSLTYPGFEINVSCAAAPTCPRPESLSIDSVGINSVTLSWVDSVGTAWTIEYGPAGFIPGDVSDTSIHFADFTTTTGTVTGLAAGCNYDFYLMSVCGTGEGDTSWTRMVNTYTACDAITTLPYLENFDGLELYSNHPCWTTGDNFSGGYPYVYYYSYFSDFASNGLYFYFAYYNNPESKAWAVMPAVSEDILMNTLELSFTNYNCYENTSYDTYGHDLLVGVIDSSAYVVGMPIDTIAVFNFSTSATNYVSFADYEGTGKNIIFLSWLNGSVSYAYLGIDDINLHLLPECNRPEDLTLVAADSTSLEISWTVPGDATEFYVEWRNVDSTTAAFSHVNANDTTYTIEGLTPNAIYTVRVSTLCSGDTSIAVVGQYRTSCVNVTTFPYLENVEGTTTDCWTSIDYNGYSGDDWQIYGYGTAHSGSNSFYSTYNAAGGVNWLISPAIEIPDDMTTANLSWYISGGSYSGIVPHYAVKVGTSLSDTTTFVTLLEEDRDDYINNEYVFVKRNVSLAQFAGQTIYVAFVRHARDDNGLYLDDISISESLEPEISLIGTTGPVVGLAATYTARLDAGQSVGLTWNWQSVRATAGAATMNTVSPTEITMLYTSAGTDTLRLIGTNTYGADTAYLVIDPVSISYSALPYSTGFEASDDTTWTLSNGPNAWYIDTAVAATGSYSLYISSDNGATNGYNNNSSSESFAYKAFNFASAGQYSISFDWRAYGESCCDYIYVYLVPANDNNMVGATSITVPGTWRALTNTLNEASSWQNASNVFNVDAPGVYYICFRWHNDGSIGTNPAAAIDNIQIAQITCPAPTALVIDNVTTTSAHFSWTPTGSETSWMVQVGNAAPVVVTDTFYTATGLNHSSNYVVRVRAICGAGDSSLYLSGNFWTECDSYQIPFYIHFNSNPLNPCWSNVTIGGSTPSTRWATSATYGYEYIYSYAPSVANATSDYLISPAIQIPATDTASIRLVLRIAGEPSSYYSGSLASYEVLVSPTGADSIAAFTDTLAIDTLNSSTFEWRRFPLSQYAGQTIRFTIRNVSKISAQVAIYDAAVRRTNVPMYVVYGSTSALTGNANNYFAEYVEGDTSGMTLSWTSSMAAAGQATMTGAATDSMQIIYTAGGVDSITFIASNAFGADTTTFFVNVFHCDVISNFPYAEGFEAQNPCWSQEGDSEWEIGTGDYSSSTGSHSGATNALITHSTSGNVTKLISPMFNLTGGGDYNLSFWHIQRSWAGDQDELRVYYRTSSTDTAWVELMSFTSDIQAWTKDSITLPNPSATYQIAFEMTDGYGYGVAIDDITIEGVAPACPAPVIDSVLATDDNIYLHFSDVADAYHVAIVEDSVWQDPASYAEIDSNSITLVSLTPSTTYTIGVRSVCAAGFYSEWVTRTVTTAEHPCYAPTSVTVPAATIDYTTAVITWTPAEADQNDFEVRFVRGADTAYFEATGTSYTATGLVYNTEYSVAVRAICGAGNYSDWSAPAIFRTTSCTGVNDVRVSDETAEGATVTWSGNSAAQAYEVAYGLPGVDQNQCTRQRVTATTYTITGLDDATTYVVYVRSECETGVYSDWSEGVTFTTETVGIDDVDSESISLYPNPASSTVTLTGVENGATVTVIDMNGRENGKWKVESGKLTIDISELTAGAYFVRITGERVNAIRKLIVR